MTQITATKMSASPQVFLSYAMADQRLAAKVSTSLSKSGLKVVRPEDLEPGHEYSNAIREGLQKSAAIVVVVSGEEMPAAVLFEIGAAFGAEKPVYVVVDGPLTRLPFSASKFRVLPINRVEEIADELLSHA